MGNCYYYVGGYKNAIEYYEKSFKILQKILGEDLNIATSCNNIGIVY